MLPDPVALIGLGEVGGIFARDLRAAGVRRLIGFDLAFADLGSAASRNAAAQRVEIAGSAAAAAAQATLVISAVTAGAALAAAEACAPGLGHAPLFLDINSVSPGTRHAAAAAVARGGGRFVEAAVMTSVPPHGLRAPMLLGGPHAPDFLPSAGALGMQVEHFSDTLGEASAVKMCRSVMIKGMEALLLECLLTARRHGVERVVLASLADTLPHPDWPGLARYMMGRALTHGRRRAEEMREVARTVGETGLTPWQSEATAERQDWAALVGAGASRAGAEADLGAWLDGVLAAANRSSAEAEA
jgi:3-hydroxyisobutyrate dehydrogenase